ncbi:unnamed protein product [Brassica napus]|uniref:HECT-type E3 ubiquitin transferase n=1 Tax=Brassica napus TaxID=3708 RepID=A0A816X4U2_BRANA|nr:unnamed protein product [Brassica napus]
MIGKLIQSSVDSKRLNAWLVLEGNNILKKMTEEERRSVLFFWTSTRFIPVEGFRGLSSKLYIYRLHEAKDHLPTSPTCFYRLCLPKYPKIGLMEKRLGLIAQDHVSSSFGQW